MTARQPQSAAEARMLGLPAGLFDMRQPGRFPGPARAADMASAAPGLGTPLSPAPQAFVWGSGGKRMSPEDIEIARHLAAQQIEEAGSTAPVGHWLQGAARALGGLTGALEMRRATAAQTQPTST